MQSRVFIFVGMVESIAIYGIVMMFIILGQWAIAIFSNNFSFCKADIKKKKILVNFLAWLQERTTISSLNSNLEYQGKSK
jgi:hypothetical protein